MKRGVDDVMESLTGALDKVTDAEARESIQEAIELLHKYRTVARSIYAEHTGALFICGEVGEKDGLGLPDYLLVCPTYGLDGFARYKKDKDYDAPGW